MLKSLILFFSLILYLSAEPLQIVYEERVPYVQKNNNILQGLVATPVIKALHKAKIDYKVNEKPSKRHLYEIKANISNICALGWFKNPQREKFAKFTKAVYQDKPLGIVARKDRIDFKNITIKKLLNNPENTVLTKASYSYGNFIDKKLETFKTKKNEVYASNEKMLLLLSKKRGDFMFISNEEYLQLIKNDSFNELSFFKIKDMPKGNKRYLICSKKVSDKTIKKINIYLK